MQRLFWLGQPYFADSLAACGWDNPVIHDFDGHQVFTWEDIIRIAGFEPDVLVVADKSLPPFVLGMENFPCLTVFYSVDSHIHSWHNLYAQGFDACLVSLADNMPQFFGPGTDRIWWSPPFAANEDQPDPDARQIWDCLFVGNMNPELMPKRVKFMEKLGQLVPGLEVRQGNYKELFPLGRTLINYADAGDLNFRVFEALGCGGCLVTPRIGHGLDKLFVDGEHIVGYAPDDPGDAAYRINFLLEHPEIAAHISQTGLAEINAKHRARHRAEALTDHLCDLAMHDIKTISQARKEKADFIRKNCLEMLYLHWAENLEDPVAKAKFVAAAKGTLNKTPN